MHLAYTILVYYVIATISLVKSFLKGRTWNRVWYLSQSRDLDCVWWKKSCNLLWCVYVYSY